MDQHLDYTAMGSRIKDARRRAGLTQEALSEAVGISLSFLGHIERGSRKASLETLYRLAAALSANLHFWITGEMFAGDSTEIIREYLKRELQKYR